MTVSEARTRHMRLQIQRLDARELGVDETSSYITHLSAAIAGSKADYVACAVVEIAAMRVDLEISDQQDETVFSN